ncbi:MAG: hypothetical protein QOI06_2572 [Nocardioidaceae bacterium]|nr:hypothetical protein [Nocardioidaceae bacterium]
MAGAVGRHLVGRRPYDVTHAPYASAQYVLEIIGDTEALWEPGGGEELMALLREWDSVAEGRHEINERICQHLRSLQERDVPPLVAHKQKG